MVMILDDEYIPIPSGPKFYHYLLVGMPLVKAKTLVSPSIFIYVLFFIFFIPMA